MRRGPPAAGRPERDAAQEGRRSRRSDVEGRARTRARSRPRRRRSSRAPCRASPPCRGRSRRGRFRPRSRARRRRPRRSGSSPPSRRSPARTAGPPPEKLITSMPSRDGLLEGGDDLRRVRDVADRRRHVEDAVVADPRARGDAREARDDGWSWPCGAVVPASPAAIPATCVPWKRRLRVEREAALPRRSPGPGTTGRRSPSASSTSCRPSGSRPDTRSRSGRRTGSPVDAVVDDADLHAVAARARGVPERVRADQRAGCG